VTLAALAPWEPAQDVVLRSAMEHRFRAAGATFTRVGPWRVPVEVPGDEECLARVAFADASHLAKLELRGGAEPAAADERVVVAAGPDRWIVLCPWAERIAVAAEPGDGRELVLDMSGAWAILVLAGPDADRLLRRLGPIAAVPGAGPIAGVPGRVLRRAGAVWVLVAVEYVQHVWDVCADLCLPLGGGPAGLAAVARAGRDPLLDPS
jgi:glycine cleavage system aminomethyltransferase T